MNLRQFHDLTLSCTFCCALMLGVDLYKQLWQPRLETWRYEDNVDNSCGDMKKDHYWTLLHGAEGGHSDERYIRNPATK